jgi:Rrf2 family transcriptional regulator, iron-sulfur cluster assembly transcription factor
MKHRWSEDSKSPTRFGQGEKSMLLSKSCRYGLRAVMFIAAQAPGRREYVPINIIAEKLNIPFHFLTKVLQQLTQASLLVSFRGPTGGVALARGPEEISVADVVVAMEGPGLFFTCVLGLEGCGVRPPCPLHKHWSEEREKIKADFQGTTIAMLAKDINALNQRLGDPEDPAALGEADAIIGTPRKPRRGRRTGA